MASRTAERRDAALTVMSRVSRYQTGRDSDGTRVTEVIWLLRLSSGGKKIKGTVRKASFATT